MKRFTFRLQRLLELRSAVERDQARSLAEARQAEAERLRHLRASQERLDSAAGQRISGPLDQATAGSLVNRDLALNRLAAEAAVADAEHTKSAAAAEQEQVKYSEAATARRAVEKLREQRLAAWNEEANRVDQHETDETAIRLSQQTRRPNP
jgi:flagellar export protein FliJ